MFWLKWAITRALVRAMKRRHWQLRKHEASCLCLAGLEAYEGNIHGKDDEDTLSLVKAYLNFAVAVAAKLDDLDLYDADDVILTAGGTAYYDLAIHYLMQSTLKEKVQVITRSGCYLLHDSGYYNNHFKHMVQRDEIAAAIQPAMSHAVEVWSYVQSTPEPGLLILTMGKRDVSYDVTMPIPLFAYRGGERIALDKDFEITNMDDQHAFLWGPKKHG